MIELLTSAQMRTLENAAISSGQVAGLALMERAGQGVVQAIFAQWPDLAAAPFRAVVLCGPGNNGGDGFVVARLLREWGCEVEVCLYGDPGKLPPDARANHDRWAAMGRVWQSGPNITHQDETDLDEGFYASDLTQVVVIDALFGVGLSRPMEDVGNLIAHLETERRRNEFNLTVRIVAVDIPSGLCADSGRILLDPQTGAWDGAVLTADMTVTFHTAKPGHFLADGPGVCGRLVVHDIGLGFSSRQISPPEASGADPAHLTLVQAPGPWLAKAPGHHKYAHGHALVLSGGPGRGGAARLAARGALRIGAGLVTLGCPTDALTESAARLDAVMLRPVAGADALTDLLQDDRITALCLGPGLGTGPREAALVAAALADKSGRCVLLDADALTLLSRAPDLFAAVHDRCVLTPHAGEFARLFPDIAARLAEPATSGPAWSRVDATRAAAARAGCTILYKGPDTVIAAPDGRCAVNSARYDRAAPWLATAGSGDVLAGFITGLLARGYHPMQAAETAAWLHVECALKFGPGLIAEDLPEILPQVFRDLGL